MPVSLRYKHNKFMFEAGLYYSKFLSSSLEDINGKIIIYQFPFKGYDFGGLIGVYYELNERIMFNLRSKNSIVPIRDFDNLDENIGILNKLFNRGWYNVDLNFTVRYQFGS